MVMALMVVVAMVVVVVMMAVVEVWFQHVFQSMTSLLR